MKKILYATMGLALLIIGLCVLSEGPPRPALEQPSLVQDEIQDSRYPRRTTSLHIKEPIPVQSLPFELSEDVAAVQLYLDTKQQLLLEQLAFVPVVSLGDEDFPKIETGRQGDEELAKWADANNHHRTLQNRATLKLLKNEQDLKSTIGDQKFAVLQAWETKMHQAEAE